MANNNRIDWTTLGPGYQQGEFASLKDFIDFLYGDLLDYGTYVWRGQRVSSWALQPSLDRLSADAKTTRTRDWNFVDKHLSAFKEAVRGRRGTNPPIIEDENDWWALGQHHGLATPLLDWTTSPFVATFFAFAETGGEQTEHRAIFALHEPTIERLARTKRLVDEQENKKLLAEQKAKGLEGGLFSLALQGPVEPDLVFFRPHSDENSRLVAQGGLFTRSRRNTPIEQWVMGQHDSEDKGVTLYKLLVPDLERDKCLQLLNRMNINPLSLFPDLSGASRYCNLFAEIENY